MPELHSERRRQILNAAKRLFRHYGFAKTTVADIARTAGVGVGTVYLEFASKSNILGELASESHADVLAAMRAASTGNGSYAERLDALFEQRLEQLMRLASGGQHGLDLLECGQCEVAKRAYERFRRDEEDLLSEFLRAASEAGEFAVQQPRCVARVLIRIHDSYANSAAQQGTDKPLGDEIAAVHALVLNGLLARRP